MPHYSQDLSTTSSNGGLEADRAPLVTFGGQLLTGPNNNHIGDAGKVLPEILGGVVPDRVGCEDWVRWGNEIRAAMRRWELEIVELSGEAIYFRVIRRRSYRIFKGSSLVRAGCVNR